MYCYASLMALILDKWHLPDILSSWQPGEGHQVHNCHNCIHLTILSNDFNCNVQWRLVSGFSWQYPTPLMTVSVSECETTFICYIFIYQCVFNYKYIFLKSWTKSKIMKIEGKY